MDALYQDRLKLAQWFWRKNWKCENNNNNGQRTDLIRKLKITVQPGLLCIAQHFFQGSHPSLFQFQLPAVKVYTFLEHLFQIRLKVCDPTCFWNIPLLLHRKFGHCGSCRCQRGGHSHRIYSWVPIQLFLHILKERPRLAVMTYLGVPLLDDNSTVLIRMICVSLSVCLFLFCLSVIPIQNFTII